MLVCERLYCGVLNSLIYKGVREMPVKSRGLEGESCDKGRLDFYSVWCEDA